MMYRFRRFLTGGTFVPFLLIRFWLDTGVMGSFHRVRVDLKVRSPDLLKKKAEDMSKPFPHSGKPLSWPEVVQLSGRTDVEINHLVTKISYNLGGQNIRECPSRQCVIADVEVDDDEILVDITDSSIDDNEASATTNASGVEDFVDRRLRQSFQDSGHDHTIISGVRRILIPDDKDDLIRRRRTFVEDVNVDSDEEPTMEPTSYFVFNTITFDISDNRNGVTKEVLNNAGNYNQFLVIPAICDLNQTNGYISMEEEQSSCPTEIKLTISPWHAENLAVSRPITYTINTESLEKTKKCSEYAYATCENSIEDQLYVNNYFFGLLSLNIAQIKDDVLVNNTYKFENNTVIRILELGQFLDQGIGSYDIQIEYPQWNIVTGTSSAYAYPGPMITPDYGKDKYNVPKGHRGAGLGVTALFEGTPNVYSEKALNAFSTGFDLPIPEIQLFESNIFQGNNISACYDPQYGGCGESNLDVQMITSYGVGAKFGFLPGGQQAIYTSNHDIFVDYREAFIENNVTPDILSLSWGGADVSVSEDFDDIAMQFTAAGITVLAASGDRGAAGTDFTGPCSPTKYYPRGEALSPAGSPWILSVGATQEAKLLESDRLEPVACMGPIGGQITSTGLIQPSEAAKLPEYQKAAVEGYLNSDAYKIWPFKASFDSPGRGVPDVSAYGNNIPNVSEKQNGELQAGAVGGTSAASPAFAGLLLQVRGALLSSPECEGIDVKFKHINPMIYWAAENRPGAFTDITVGNNVFDGQGSTLETAYCGFGYVATEGWDPVTGVGMMNFPVFVEAAKEWYCKGIGRPTNPPTKKQAKKAKKSKKYK